MHLHRSCTNKSNKWNFLPVLYAWASPLRTALRHLDLAQFLRRAHQNSLHVLIKLEQHPNENNLSPIGDYGKMEHRLRVSKRPTELIQTGEHKDHRIRCYSWNHPQPKLQPIEVRKGQE